MGEKKLGLLFSVSLIFIVLTLVLSFQFLSAELVNVNPTSGEAEVFGINPADVPTTPQDAANVSLNYLKAEWQKIIAKTPYIGPIHNFLLNNQMIMIVLFNTQYEFSLTFICIFVLWLYFWFLSSDYIDSYGIIKMGLPWLAGLGVALILAHVGLIKLLVDTCLNIIYAKDLWWARLLIWMGIIAIFFLVGYAEQILKEANVSGKKKKEEQELKEETKVNKKFREGFEEGAGI